ncbi:MAG TPA: hypothetical protein VIH18_02950 [Candidatus Binatia bacterium]|jgi:hypothetical protein
MDKIRMILAPTDLSELSLAGVNYALELAQSQDAELRKSFYQRCQEVLGR